VLFSFARGATGAIERPAFPAPSIFKGHNVNENLAQMCGEIAKPRLANDAAAV
jgi:hypothetical protein